MLTDNKIRAVNIKFSWIIMNIAPFMFNMSDAIGSCLKTKTISNANNYNTVKNDLEFS